MKRTKNKQLSVLVLGDKCPMTVEANVHITDLMDRDSGSAMVLDYLAEPELMKEAIKRHGGSEVLVTPTTDEEGYIGFFDLQGVQYATPVCREQNQVLATTLLFLLRSSASQDTSGASE